MRRKIILGAILVCIYVAGQAQQSFVDSLKLEIGRSSNDTVQLLRLIRVANVYSEINPDSAYHFAEKMLVLSRKLDLKLEEVVAQGEMGYALLNLGNYPRSLQTLLSAIALARDPDSERKILPVSFPATDDFTDRTVPAGKQRLAKLSRVMQYIGILYGNAGNYEKAIGYFSEAIPYASESGNLRILSITYTTLGRTYSAVKKQDSALICLQKAYDYAVEAKYDRYLGSILLNMGRVYLAMGKQGLAKEYFERALRESTEQQYFRGVVASNLALADVHKNSSQQDSSLYYLRNGLLVASGLNAPDLYLRTYTSLADFYRKAGNNDSLVKYQSLIIRINDSLFNSKQAQQFQNIDFDARQRQLEKQATEKEYRNRLQKYLMLAGLAVFLMAAIFLMRINRHRQKTNARLLRQNEEIEVAMATLKSTQAQLIQSEKMASLGELTAGIAHEIQNPLNFVNNFAELNRELATELKLEIEQGNMGESKQIAADIQDNSTRISEHGKRAEAIVKSMLLHSRAGSGQKGSTDINALADEYLKLAFHGMRSKESSFNVTLETAFDPAAGKIDIIPQDIGRVLQNLYNNAFHAANERKKMGETNVEPKVTVSTRRLVNSRSEVLHPETVEISVQDNGGGIPENIRGKIFQPFFTTKPTGQGTGLGLSISYDIVKAHGGTIEVYSVPGEGSKFRILLPV